MLTGVQEWRRLCGSLEPDETLTWRNEAEAQPAMACPQRAGTERGFLSVYFSHSVLSVVFLASLVW